MKAVASNSSAPAGPRLDLAYALNKMADVAARAPLGDLQHRWANLQMIVPELLRQIEEAEDRRSGPRDRRAVAQQRLDVQSPRYSSDTAGDRAIIPGRRQQDREVLGT